jgi:hypothetical protein
MCFCHGFFFKWWTCCWELANIFGAIVGHQRLPPTSVVIGCRTYCMVFSATRDAHRRHSGTALTPQTDERVVLMWVVATTAAGGMAQEKAGWPATRIHELRESCLLPPAVDPLPPRMQKATNAGQPTVPLACNEGAGKRRE